MISNLIILVFSLLFLIQCTPKSEKQKWIVGTKDINVYEETNINSNIVGVIEKGIELIELERTKEFFTLNNSVSLWIKIQTKDERIKGWVIGSELNYPVTNDFLIQRSWTSESGFGYIPKFSNEGVEILFAGEGCGSVSGKFAVQNYKVNLNLEKESYECENNKEIFQQFNNIECSVINDFNNVRFEYRMICKDNSFYSTIVKEKQERIIEGIPVITLGYKNYTINMPTNVYQSPDIHSHKLKFTFIGNMENNTPIQADDIEGREVYLIARTKNFIPMGDKKIHWIYIDTNCDWYSECPSFGWILDEKPE